MEATIVCGECSRPVPREFWNREERTQCRCFRDLRAVVFPAVGRTRRGTDPAPLGTDTDASCFFHPQSRALVPCDECGRFLCGLCDLEIDGRHLCPRCFELGAAPSRLGHMETRRVMYDAIALALASLPALLIWPAILGAPAALFVVVRRWKTPLSIVPRTKIRYYLAAVFALAEFGGIGFIVWLMFRFPPRA